MILFIDDEPRTVRFYLDEISSRGVAVKLIATVSELDDYLSKNEQAPECIVLDVMFPGQPGFPNYLTSFGMRTGLTIFGGLRSQFSDTHIVIFTASHDIEVTNFFRNQDNCTLLHKGSVLPVQFADLVIALAQDRGSLLLEKLEKCPASGTGKEYEAVVREVLEFLFVPPLGRIQEQLRREDNHEIIDLSMSNNAAVFFWDRVLNEFDAKSIVIEIKNKDQVNKDEVNQLRIYLSRPSRGRFGLLISRLPPSPSALRSRRDAYSDEEKLILFLSNADLRQMIEMRRRGGDPTAFLQLIKDKFESTY